MEADTPMSNRSVREKADMPTSEQKLPEWLLDGLNKRDRIEQFKVINVTGQDIKDMFEIIGHVLAPYPACDDDVIYSRLLIVREVGLTYNDDHQDAMAEGNWFRWSKGKEETGTEQKEHALSREETLRAAKEEVLMWLALLSESRPFIILVCAIFVEIFRDLNAMVEVKEKQKRARTAYKMMGDRIKQLEEENGSLSAQVGGLEHQAVVLKLTACQEEREHLETPEALHTSAVHILPLCFAVMYDCLMDEL